MQGATHTFKIELTGDPLMKLEGEAEFNTDGEATYMITNYNGFEGLSLERGALLNELIHLAKKVTVEFGEISKIKIEKIII